ncbi:MAG: aspartate kinase, partial [Rikenellaceae bacterium]|nr:aspartate kinase [Rikenellaceae bacterium]
MIKVLKFGGTSMGSARNMKQVADVIQREGARITVLSAMSGTTDALVKIGALARKGNLAEIELVMAGLTEKYADCIDDLLTANKTRAMDRMNVSFRIIRDQAAQFIPETSNKTILSQGELLTSAIFAMYLEETGAKATLLNAPDFVHSDTDGKPDAARIHAMLPGLAADAGTCYITQGFISTNSVTLHPDNLGRGGSDYSAALMGAAIGADEVQIWTDIDGMHNNDPRFVDKTFPIRQMNFDEAAELAYFGAKILHPATIQPCKDYGIPVRLKNTMDPTAPGTLITNENSPGNGFRAVAAKDNITVVRIHSARMLMAYGFLRKVFEIFEANKTSIDMITTSEVSISLTLDNDEHLEQIENELKEFGSIEIERNNTIVCVVGQ